jgi:hypothetical protein
MSLDVLLDRRDGPQVLFVEALDDQPSQREQEDRHVDVQHEPPGELVPPSSGSNEWMCTWTVARGPMRLSTVYLYGRLLTCHYSALHRQAESMIFPQARPSGGGLCRLMAATLAKSWGTSSRTCPRPAFLLVPRANPAFAADWENLVSSWAWQAKVGANIDLLSTTQSAVQALGQVAAVIAVIA